MSSSRDWAAYQPTYREKEIKAIARWISAGESGSVVGLPGSGKSNLLGFLAHHPEAVQVHLPESLKKLALVQIDLNNLPKNDDLSTLYRVILRSLFENQARLIALDPTFGTTVETLYRKVETQVDPFISQSALRELLILFRERLIRLVLIFDPFDQFCREANTQMIDNLRSLRDSFKTTLSYLIGIRDELAMLRDPEEIGEIYELFDTQVCLVGAMIERDAQWVIDQVSQSTGVTFAEEDIEQMLILAGNYPSLLKAIAQWREANTPVGPRTTWLETLLNDPVIQHRLREIWDNLAQPEQLALIELEQQSSPEKIIAQQNSPYLEVWHSLAAKGVVIQENQAYRLRSPLLAVFAAERAGVVSNRIWLDDKTGIVYQNQRTLNNLTPLERSILEFLINHPFTRHTKTDLIINTWPEELRQHGVADQSLYQVILELRKKIEPVWTKPRYLVTWRGKPEGGYQFFPEGRP